MDINRSKLSSNLLVFYILILLLITPILGSISIVFKSQLIWSLGVPISLLIFYINRDKLNTIPKEYWRYGSLILFSLLGFFRVIDFSDFTRYFQVLVANLVLMIMLYLAVNSYDQLDKILVSIFISVSAIVLISFFMETGEAFTGSGKDRLEGLVGNSNGTATYARVSVILGLYILQNRLTIFKKITLWTIIFISGFAIILTASRGNFANLVFILISYVYIVRFKNVNLKTYVLAVSLLLFFLGTLAMQLIDDFYLYERLTQSEANSVEELQEKEARVRLYVKAITAIVEHPFLGVGLNQFRHYSGGHISHTDMLDIGSQLGIIAMFLYVSIYVRLFKKLRVILRIFKENIKVRILLILFLSEVIFGLTNPNWFLQLDMLLLSILIVNTNLNLKVYGIG
tara:strand:+ start:60 stop:1256 length:1197 start_codon:yes stop_codon:yes gene_type:complete